MALLFQAGHALVGSDGRAGDYGVKSVTLLVVTAQPSELESCGLMAAGLVDVTLYRGRQSAKATSHPHT